MAPLSPQGRKKKFIDKKESSTFHVVHRSQQDKANEGEEEASEFVLIPSGVSELPPLRVFACVVVVFCFGIVPCSNARLAAPAG